MAQKEEWSRDLVDEGSEYILREFDESSPGQVSTDVRDQLRVSEGGPPETKIPEVAARISHVEQALKVRKKKHGKLHYRKKRDKSKSRTIKQFKNTDKEYNTLFSTNRIRKIPDEILEEDLEIGVLDDSSRAITQTSTVSSDSRYPGLDFLFDKDRTTDDRFLGGTRHSFVPASGAGPYSFQPPEARQFNHPHAKPVTSVRHAAFHTDKMPTKQKEEEGFTSSSFDFDKKLDAALEKLRKRGRKELSRSSEAVNSQSAPSKEAGKPPRKKKNIFSTHTPFIGIHFFARRLKCSELVSNPRDGLVKHRHRMLCLQLYYLILASIIVIGSQPSQGYYLTQTIYNFFFKTRAAISPFGHHSERYDRNKKYLLGDIQPTPRPWFRPTPRPPSKKQQPPSKKGKMLEPDQIGQDDPFISPTQKNIPSFKKTTKAYSREPKMVLTTTPRPRTTQKPLTLPKFMTPKPTTKTGHGVTKSPETTRKAHTHKAWKSIWNRGTIFPFTRRIKPTTKAQIKTEKPTMERGKNTTRMSIRVARNAKDPLPRFDFAEYENSLKAEILRRDSMDSIGLDMENSEEKDKSLWSEDGAILVEVKDDKEIDDDNFVEDFNRKAFWSKIFPNGTMIEPTHFQNIDEVFRDEEFVDQLLEKELEDVVKFIRKRKKETEKREKHMEYEKIKHGTGSDTFFNADVEKIVQNGTEIAPIKNVTKKKENLDDFDSGPKFDDNIDDYSVDFDDLFDDDSEDYKTIIAERKQRDEILNLKELIDKRRSELMRIDDFMMKSKDPNLKNPTKRSSGEKLPEGNQYPVKEDELLYPPSRKSEGLRDAEHERRKRQVFLWNYRREYPPCCGKCLREFYTDHDFRTFINSILPLAYIFEYWHDFKRPRFKGKISNFRYTFDNRLLTVLRLRQIRVRYDSCTIPPDLTRLFDTCFDYYSLDAEDQIYIRHDMLGVAGAEAWKYKSEKQTGSSGYYGVFGNYGGGGFTLDLADDVRRAIEVIDTLSNYGWVNRATRLVIAEMPMYNPSTNCFLLARIVFEFPPTGGVMPFADFVPVKLLRYVSKFDFFILGCEISFAIITFFLILEYIFYWRQNNIRICCAIAPLFNMCVFVLAIITIIFAGVRYVLVRDFFQDEAFRKFYVPEWQITRYINYFSIGSVQKSFDGMCAVLLGMIWLQTMQFMVFSKFLVEMRATFLRALSDLIGLWILIVIVLLAFAMAGFLFFGERVLAFRDIPHAFLAVLQGVVGNINYKDLEEANNWVAPIYFCLFVFFLIYIVMNVMAAVVVNAYSHVSSHLTPEEKFAVNYASRACVNVLSCLTCKLSKQIEPNPTYPYSYTTLRSLLKRAGFTEKEVDGFLCRYRIDENSIINDAENRRIIRDLELSYLDSNQLSEEAQIYDLKDKLDKLGCTVREIQKNLQPALDKIDLILNRVTLY